MRGSLEARLRRMWRGEGRVGDRVLATLALPPELLFRLGVTLRRRAYDLGAIPSRKGAIPVVSVGNLAVGGTGKTPVSGWLVRELQARGWDPALVSRGYGADELLLHQRWNPEVPTIRAVRRIEGVEAAVRQGRNIVVLDDGFQHRGLRRDLDVLLLSPAHPLRGRLLPRGPFREPWSATRRADHILVTAKGEEEMEGARRLVAEIRDLPGLPPVDLFPLEAGEWETVEGVPMPPPQGRAIVLTSVAEGDGFLCLVAGRVGRVRGHLAFPDHHPYSEGDIRRIAAEARGGWVATTEKDAVKLIAFRELLPDLRVLPLVASPAADLAERLLNRLPMSPAAPEGP